MRLLIDYWHGLYLFRQFGIDTYVPWKRLQRPVRRAAAVAGASAPESAGRAPTRHGTGSSRSHPWLILRLLGPFALLTPKNWRWNRNIVTRDTNRPGSILAMRWFFVPAIDVVLATTSNVSLTNKNPFYVTEVSVFSVKLSFLVNMLTSLCRKPTRTSRISLSTEPWLDSMASRRHLAGLFSLATTGTTSLLVAWRKADMVGNSQDLLLCHLLGKV